MELLAKTPTTKAPAERFTGDVWVDMLAVGEAPSRLTAAAVHFAPCARTAWHRHALGQTLHVTEGIGLVQTRDGRTIVLRPGDTVHTPPDEWHWHGAAPDHFMTHLALSESAGIAETPDVEWGEHVTDDQYGKAAQSM
ncbi:cupin domain-containing protein [Streptomyces phaeochromogenes]|uniref:Cupin domain-containing protein n=1 Tax=Streptomyces phaeochromogenes TaxID=1923 RepID=A0ABZ1HB54_STRPH|nr:cupin domain-containing protein [Streptomyces phaeochromogenes]WSD14363.1 cupin domain-containing protein [Streptomyces phaeochromogenes]